MTIPFLFLLFIIYSVIGWISEVVYCSILDHKLVNRGFLHGPLCPVYGFGGLLVIFLLKPYSGNIVYLFIMAVVLASILEYITGWALETIFATKWWDYSRYRFNLHGRICVRNSLMFGLMSVVGVLFVHPFVLSSVGQIPFDVQTVLAFILAVALLIDFALTLKTLIHIDQKLSSLREFSRTLQDNLDVREWFNERDLRGSLSRLHDLVSRDNSPSLGRIAVRFDQLLSHSKGVLRIAKAFPSMHSKNHSIQIDAFKILREREIGKFKNFTTPVVNVESDMQNDESGLGLYHSFWAFVVAGFIGVVVEIAWCALRFGYIENRTGLIYGIFNPVYGVGGVVLLLLLYRKGKSRDLFVFLSSMVIGGLFEYLWSFGQQILFGSVSWEYSNAQLNLGGRTDLMHSFMWGLLGLVWVREIFPHLLNVLAKIPRGIGKKISILLFIAFMVNFGISGFAVHRWSERNHGIAPKNTVDVFLDQKYPDTLLRKLFPNMQFIE